MAFMVKHVVGGQLKNLTGGLTEDKSDGDKSDAAAKGMTQEELEQYQQQLEEEKQERDANFAQKKAERATVRSHFRDKYRLPKVTINHTLCLPSSVHTIKTYKVHYSTENERRAHKHTGLNRTGTVTFHPPKKKVYCA
uniref:Complexin 3b n=1 Tax=Sinocyclocheilus rhinocerous TaxID=307959 RepID=A0A673LST2_9TELE